MLPRDHYKKLTPLTPTEIMSGLGKLQAKADAEHDKADAAAVKKKGHADLAASHVEDIAAVVRARRAKRDIYLLKDGTVTAEVPNPQRTLVECAKDVLQRREEEAADAKEKKDARPTPKATARTGSDAIGKPRKAAARKGKAKGKGKPPPPPKAA